MEKTADLEPLDARREFKTLVLAEKVNRLPTLTLHTKLNSLTKNRLRRQSLNYTVKSRRRQKGVQHSYAEILQPDTWTPRNLIPQIRAEILGLGKKGEHPPALQKSLTHTCINVGKHVIYLPLVDSFPPVLRFPLQILLTATICPKMLKVALYPNQSIQSNLYFVTLSSALDYVHFSVLTLVFG